jgi:thioredoxin-like negative regulator of GroEL
MLGYVYVQFQNDPLAAVMAEDALQKALKTDPGNISAIEARLLLARLLMNRGAYAMALDQLEEAVKKDPRLLVSPLAADMCRAYVTVSQAPRGEGFFQAILTSRPESGPARLALALLIHAQGRNDESLRQLAILTGDGKNSKEDTEFARKLSRQWQEKKS